MVLPRTKSIEPELVPVRQAEAGGKGRNNSLVELDALAAESLRSIAMKPRNRQSRSLNVLNSRWMAYAAASAATFVVGCQAAEGAIHYSGPVNVKLSGKPNKIVTFQLDRPGDSIAFQHVYHFTYFAGFKVLGIQSREFVGSEGIDYHSVYRLHRNEEVSQDHLTSPGINEFVSLAPGGGFFKGGI
jgi:hypothetical protein